MVVEPLWYLRGKVAAKQQVQLEREVSIRQRNTSADTKISEEEGEEVLQVPEQIPLQPMVKNMMRQAVPLQSMKVFKVKNLHGDIHIYVLYQQ